MYAKYRFLVIPAIVSAIAAVLAATGLASGFDWKLYDAMLRLRQAPAEFPAILLTDFDDEAITTIGAWPIGRDVVAEGLATMGELGAAKAVFDIEYVDRSPRGVDARYLEEEIPESFKEGFGSVAENVRNLFSAVSSGRMPVSAAGIYAEDLVASTDELRDALLEKVGKVASDNDDKLGKAARFFGSAWFTVNMRKEQVPGTDSDAKLLALQIADIPVGSASEDTYAKAVDILPTISPILSRSAGAGFPNVYVDPDGVRRRIDIFYRYGNQNFAQLVIAPLLNLLGSPKVLATKDAFVLEQAVLPTGESVNIRIPRTEDGRMLINWPHEDYISSFRHLSFKEFLVHEELFEDLAHNLRIRDDWGYFSGYEGEIPLAALFAQVQAQRRSWMEDDEAPPENAAALIREARDAAIAETESFLSTRPEDRILEQVQAVLASDGLDAETRGQYELIRDDAPAYFEKTRTLLADLSSQRVRLLQELEGAFCIIGFTATGTTDIGVNPFDGEYVNVGTHAAVLNTILQRSFLDDTPWWVPALIALVSSFSLTFIINGKKPVVEIGIGFALTILLAAVFAFLFVFMDIFAHPILPLLASFSTFLVITIVSFLRTEKEKGFLRNAFSHYLSNDVIKQIISDPEKLKLGGAKRHMTAVFTDIRGFSTISEKLTPEDLVRLLNQYLSGMSDVILDLKGTIDKYEGDAIIAFFGAPLDLDDHAVRACQAAAAMKRLENRLNERFLSDGTAPSPLLTRIGLNTGDMVVGNMGTDRKMDYTIIGDAVNLAARLEGVNKQYGTWICASEDTVNAAGPSIFFRKLDRIRVVGKSQPIRLYELVEERSALRGEDLDFYDGFEKALGTFEERNWRQASERFRDLLKDRPEDGPSKIYLGRADTYIEKPPVPEWDGVYNLTAK